MCKAIESESEPIFYQTAKMNINELIEVEYGSIKPLFNASLLRHVNIHLGPTEHTMAEAVKLMTNLKQLTFTCDTEDSAYIFSGGWSPTERVPAFGVAYIQEYPWRILGFWNLTTMHNLASPTYHKTSSPSSQSGWSAIGPSASSPRSASTTAMILIQ